MSDHVLTMVSFDLKSNFSETLKAEVSSELTPTDRLEIATRELDEDLQRELLERILDQSPAFFERLVVTLLSSMGYGSEGTLAKAIGKSGDGGIDGVIHQDKLGLDCSDRRFPS